MKRLVNECMSFTGGAEPTPTVTVVRYRCPGNLNNGEPSLLIEQGGRTVMVSPETLTAILNWYQGEHTE